MTNKQVQFEQIVKMSEEELFDYLRIEYPNAVTRKDGCIHYPLENALLHTDCHSAKSGYILVPGEVPLLLTAHLDRSPDAEERASEVSFDGFAFRSPQGIGGGRCGVYALIRIYEELEETSAMPWLLFTCDEGRGSLGAGAFAEDYEEEELDMIDSDTFKMVIGLDQRGSREAVFYDCDDPKFKAYIFSKGFDEALGIPSDIRVISPVLEVASASLSCGFCGEHPMQEYVIWEMLEDVIAKVGEIAKEVGGEAVPHYTYWYM